MKITNQQRNDIIKACAKVVFSERETALDVLRTALGDALYQQKHGDAAKIADKLPEGWCDTTKSIRISMQGFSRHGGDSRKASDLLPLSKIRRSPHSDMYGNKTTEPETEVVKAQAQTVIDTFEKLRDDKEIFDSKIRGIVYGCSTLAKLLEAWPEGEPYFPKDDQPKRTQLVPIELTAAVNKIMGLTPAVKAQP